MSEEKTIDQQVLPWGNPDYVANPYPWYDEARRHYPIYQDLDGTYVLTRYEDVVKYGKLPSLSIVAPPSVPKGPWAALETTVINLDPPRHTAMRRPINKWFTPKLVKRWSEAAEAFTLAHLAKTADGEVFEANLQLGVGPTHAAMCKALQVPEDRFDIAIFGMHKTMRALSETATEADNQAAVEAFAAIRERSEALLRWKQENPGDGMADALLAMYDAEQISGAEMVQSMMLLWGSGGHNPSYIISASIEYFARHPEVYEIFKNQPEKRAAFISEIYRLYPPELSFSRFATEDIEILGVQIKKDECVKFIMDSANRDPEIFPNPDQLDLDRPADSLQHVSFGMGVHQCAGQIISRGGIDTVLNTLADHVERFELKGTPEMDSTGRSRAYVSLPISIVKKPALIHKSEV